MLVAGSVTVSGPDPLGESGSGLAWAIYTADKATAAILDPDVPPEGWPSGPEAWAVKAKVGRYNLLKELARKATAYAAGMVGYLTANAEVEVKVTISTGGLQRTPNPNNPNTDTVAPSTEKTLSGTIS